MTEIYVEDDVVELVVDLLSKLVQSLKEAKRQKEEQARQDELDLVRWHGDGGR